jgi:hypothetical protein
MSQSNPTSEWLKWWQNAVEKSMQSNSRFVQEAWNMYTKAYSPTTPNGAAKDWSSLLQEYVQFNTRLSEQYLQAYQQWMGSLTPTGTPAQDESRSRASAQQPGNPLELRITGHPGEEVTTSFSLHNEGTNPKSGLFFQSSFFSLDTGDPAGIECTIEPPAIRILSGESQMVKLQLTLPKGLATGPYRAQLIAQGFDNAHFVILLDVSKKGKK